MATLTLTDTDRRKAEEAVQLFEPTTHMTAKQLTDYLPSERWIEVAESFRVYVRDRARMCAATRAYLDTLVEEGLASPGGIEHLFRFAQADIPDFGTAHFAPPGYEEFRDTIPVNPDTNKSVIQQYLEEVGEWMRWTFLDTYFPQGPAPGN